MLNKQEKLECNFKFNIYLDNLKNIKVAAVEVFFFPSVPFAFL